MKALFAACAMLVLAGCVEKGPKPLTAADIAATATEISATDQKIKEIAAKVSSQCKTVKVIVSVGSLYFTDPAVIGVLENVELVRSAYCAKPPPTDVASLIRVSADLAIAINAALVAAPDVGVRL